MRMHLLVPPRPARRPPQPPSPSPAPPPSLQDRYASLHFSDIRSTFEKHIQDDHCDQCCMQESLDAPCRSLADLAIDTTATDQPCEECIQECEEEDCQVQLTEQCTDQCVVVPCNDAHHDSLPQNTADFMCVDGTDCSALDNFLQCCANMDYHQLFPDSKPLPVSNVSSSSSQWPAFTDPMFQSYMPTAPSPPSSMQGSLYYTDSASSTPQLAASPITNFQADPSPGPQPQMPGPTIEQQQQQAPPAQQHRCMWAECGATFPSMNDLVGHVNLQHLRLPPQQEQAQVHQQTYQQFAHDQQQQLNNNNQNNSGGNNGQMDPSSLACLWADCRVYPTPASIPGPSMGDQANNIIGILASHLMQDHLGLTASTAAVPSTTTTSTTTTQHQAKPRTRTRTPSPSLTLSSHTHPLSNSLSHAQRTPTPSPPTPAPEHDCTSPSAHICRWRHCGETFSSCDALTAHITSAHVGGGKAHYECFWEGCRRNSEGATPGAAEESNGGNGGGGSGGGGAGSGGGGLGGFSSKQKICRHLQSHTGHRPFQCKICQQNFSEAATLAQHMRRHTQEKPYVCDFPGCGKSFAITGALTIHKRTHNGHKPFKCTFCDRAFTESSNLSKHLRTHTGVRPYPCTEPGCAKTFARPDQLARHMTVHRKKAGGVGGVGGVGGAAAGRGNTSGVDGVKAGEVDVKA